MVHNLDDLLEACSIVNRCQLDGTVYEFGVFNAQIRILPHSRDSFPLISDIHLNIKLDKFVHCT